MKDPVAISRKRKQELMCEALSYAGQLVRSVVDSYDAFTELPDHEQDFIAEYIVSVGERLMEQADERRTKNRAARRAALRYL